MYYYAVLNTKDIVEYISEQENEVTYYEYISISTADQSLVGKWYDRYGTYGTVGAFIEVPISIQAEHSSSQISYKGQDVWLDDKLDSYATQSNLSSGLEGKANVNHTHNTATQTADGYMGSDDKAKLDGIEASANNYTHPETHPASMITGLSTVSTTGSYNDLTDKPTIPTIPTALPADGGNADTLDGYHAAYFASGQHNHDGVYAAATHTHDYAASSHIHGEATTSSSGFMSASDKTKLNGIASGANNYTHPSSHSASMITETDSLKIMTAAERTKLAGIAENANNYIHPETHSAAIIEETSAKKVMTAEERTKLAGIESGANNYSHPSTHPATMITGLSSVATSGSYDDLSNKPTSMAPTAHTHAQSEITGLETALSGKASSSHSHSNASTTTAGFMSSTDKSKLDGIASNANNYSHPSTHAASMITGLADVATSGSYSDLSDTPTSMTPTDHTHAQSDITGLATALSGKASSSHNHDSRYYTGEQVDELLSGFASANHTHTAAQVGAAASNHNHNSAYVSKNLQFTDDNGSFKIAYNRDDGKNILNEMAGYSIGFYTIYSQSGTSGNPKTTEAWRIMFHKTGTSNGWVQAYGSIGSVYTNYLDAGSWRGWKCIWDNSPEPLWSGAMYMTSINSTPQTVTPSKKLSECRNGWLLLWSDYDPGDGANDADFVTTMIPKKNPTGGTWGGKSFLCDIPRYVGSDPADTSTEKRIIKPIYVHDDCIKGSYQNASGDRNDVVLRAVYEY